MKFPCLAFLNLSSSTSQVLSWFVNIVTGAQVINYIVICTTHLFFYRTCRVQGLDRPRLPYYGKFQPYCGWIGLVIMTTILGIYGYSIFLPGKRDVKSFFTYYTMVFIAPVPYFGWKITHRTEIVKPEEADLVWVAPAIGDYEATFEEDAPGFWVEIAQIFGFYRKRKGASFS